MYVMQNGLDRKFIYRLATDPTDTYSCTAVTLAKPIYTHTTSRRYTYLPIRTARTACTARTQSLSIVASTAYFQSYIFLIFFPFPPFFIKVFYVLLFLEIYHSSSSRVQCKAVIQTCSFLFIMAVYYYCFVRNDTASHSDGCGGGMIEPAMSLQRPFTEAPSTPAV